MNQTLLVAGLSGRVGRVLVPYLTAAGLRLEPLGRALIEDLAARRADPVAHLQSPGILGLVNLAGMAHVASGSAVDEVELWRANVEVPLLLQQVAGNLDVCFVHLSSTKAARPRRRLHSVYGESKRAAEILLHSAQLKAEGSSPTRIVRSCAVLAPPYDAGRLAVLSKLSPGGRWPGPNLRLPVVEPETLAKTILAALNSHDPSCYSVHEISADQMVPAREVVRQLHTPSQVAS